MEQRALALEQRIAILEQNKLPPLEKMLELIDQGKENVIRNFLFWEPTYSYQVGR